MPVYQTPDVYVEEIATLPPSVAEVSTAIPAFIGYTAYDSLKFKPARITSFLEFTTLFGEAPPIQVAVTAQNGSVYFAGLDEKDTMHIHTLYYAMDLYFKNGGSDCYIVSLGAYKQKAADDFVNGIDALLTEDEPTLIVLSEAATLDDPSQYYTLCQQALKQCADLQDRFCILDTLPPKEGFDEIVDFRINLASDNQKYGAVYYPYLNTSLNYICQEDNVIVSYANKPGQSFNADPLWVFSSLPATSEHEFELKFTSDKKISFSLEPTTIGQTKYTTLNIKVPTEIEYTVVSGNKNETKTRPVTVQDVVEAWMAWADHSISGYDIWINQDAKDSPVKELPAAKAISGEVSTSPLSALKQSETALYNTIKQELGRRLKVVLPPASAIAGVYALTDRTRGVWKAPANVSLSAVISPAVKISASRQESLNVDPTGGKSINAIRSFPGKGILVWGARTLAGNDNEWRYVPVRRLFIMIEESAKKASYFAVFEPNTAATWLKVRGMLESFLYGLWQQGAMAGSTSKAAYYVNVGLGITMTQQDVLEGRMIVEIGIAAVRPAEFVVLRFSHKLQEA